MDRKELLQQALSAVAERPTAYGTPENNFRRIAALWTAFHDDGRVYSLADVASMLVLLKQARLKETPGHPDSWVDTAGYAACGAEVAVPAVSQELMSSATEQATPFVLQAGKRYRDRVGNVWGPLNYPGPNRGFPFFCGNGRHTKTWTLSGRWLGDDEGGEAPLDLVEEVVDEPKHPHGQNWTGVRLFVPEEDDGA